MSNPGAFNELMTVLTFLGVEESLKRLEGVKGPERSLVAQAAERAERQGAAEGLREGRRVAPVKALAAYREGARLIRAAAMLDQKIYDELEEAGDCLNADFYGRRGDLFTRALANLEDWLPEPESEADAPASPPTGDASTEAPASPPAGGKRSGRRNVQAKP